MDSSPHSRTPQRRLRLPAQLRVRSTLECAPRRGTEMAKTLSKRVCYEPVSASCGLAWEAGEKSQRGMVCFSRFPVSAQVSKPAVQQTHVHTALDVRSVIRKPGWWCLRPKNKHSIPLGRERLGFHLFKLHRLFSFLGVRSTEGRNLLLRSLHVFVLVTGSHFQEGLLLWQLQQNKIRLP